MIPRANKHGRVLCPGTSSSPPRPVGLIPLHRLFHVIGVFDSMPMPFPGIS